jgi:hypothetical protein
LPLDPIAQITPLVAAVFLDVAFEEKQPEQRALIGLTVL